jgi:ABC-type Fe3+ transport system substrate-binding protein
LIVKRHGWTFIDSLVSQNVTWLRGTGTPSELIAKPQNELAVSFAASPTDAAVVSSKLPTEDHYVTWPQTGAIFASTKMPETAKLFMSYVMSDEWQAVAFPGSVYATRKQFDTNGVLNQTLTNPLGFVTFMQDRANVERWRFQFETTLGTPQGVSPLLDNIV